MPTRPRFGLSRPTFLAVIIIAGFCLFSAGFVIFYADGRGPSHTEKMVLIPKGTGISKMALIMEKENVLKHPFLFRLAYHAFHHNQPLKAGEYDFKAGITPREILTKLANGDIYYRQITIPEGMTTSEILAALKENEFLSGETPIDLNEGELLPETYNFSREDSRTSLLERMYVKRYGALEELWRTRADNLPFNSREEAVILASIVEKETGMVAERGRVAAVFINRLRKNMKLQSDPTVIYALTKGEKPLERELSRKDLNTNSLYNSYLHTGLPPGPICNPGIASLAAVLNPPETDEYYFVADGNGGHNFAKTLAEHNRNVRQYRKLKNAAKLSEK